MAPSPLPRPRRPPGAALALVAVLAAACTSAGAQPDAAPRGGTTTARPCDAAADPTATPIVRIRAGGCPVPVGTAYRCAPRMDPVVVVDGRRYLGGRFGVRVRTSPDDARTVGTSDGSTFLAAPDGRLFSVSGDGATERWLELPATTPRTFSAAVLGDSIALGSSEAIVARLRSWSTSIDAVVGRPSAGGVALAPPTAASSPTAVVVELGTNDDDVAAFARNAGAILRSLSDVPLVVWVEPHAPAAAADAIRGTIVRRVGRTANGVVADWDAFVPPDALSSDGVHLLPERVGVFADFVARPLRSWRMAVLGMGATSCVPTGTPPAGATGRR